jgi:hypothetical protein
VRRGRLTPSALSARESAPASAACYHSANETSTVACVRIRARIVDRTSARGRRARERIRRAGCGAARVALGDVAGSTAGAALAPSLASGQNILAPTGFEVRIAADRIPGTTARAGETSHKAGVSAAALRRPRSRFRPCRASIRAGAAPSGRTPRPASGRSRSRSPIRRLGRRECLTRAFHLAYESCGCGEGSAGGD